MESIPPGRPSCGSAVASSDPVGPADGRTEILYSCDSGRYSGQGTVAASTRCLEIVAHADPLSLIQDASEADAEDSPQLEHARAAYDAALQAYEREKARHAHLWGRFRDSVQLYLAMLAGLGFVTQALVQHPSIAGFVLLVLAIVMAAVCGHKLYVVFDGQDLKEVIPSHIYQAFWDQSAHLSHVVSGRPAPTRRELQVTESLFASAVQDVSLAQAFFGLSVAVLQAADDHFDKSTQRERELRDARPLLLAAFLAGSAAWFTSLFQMAIQ